LQFQIQLAQGTGRVKSRDGVFDPEGLNVGTESLSKVGDSLFFGLTLSVGWYVGYGL